MTAIRIVDDHLELANIGSNTHAQIDTKLAASVPYTGATSDVDLGGHDLATTGVLSSRGLKILGNYTLAWRNPADTVTNAYLHYDGNLQMRNVSGNITLQADLIDLGTTPLTTTGTITGVISHADLTNLGADDHTQYVLADSTRDIVKDQNGITNIVVDNGTNGTAAKAAFRVQTDGGSASFSGLSAGHTTSNQYKGDGALLESDANLSAGLHLSAIAGEIGFWQGNTRRGSIWNDGKWKIGTGVPAEMLDVAGNIAVSGTVDGIDISGIEAGATADQTKADIDGLGLSHDSLVDVSVNDHHNELHSIASHNDTTATGAQLDTLTDNSIADALHRHSELVASDGSPDPALSMDSSGNAFFAKRIHATQKIELTGDDASYPTNRMLSYSNAGWQGCFWSNYRARGTKVSPTTLVSGDYIFYFDVWGYDGSSNIRGGQLSSSVDGAVSTGIVPVKWEFKTMDTSGVLRTSLIIKNDGRVSIGTNPPVTSALLDLTSTTGALLLTRMTTTQRDALTAVNGMVLYNSTLNKFQGYENGAWTSLI